MLEARDAETVRVVARGEDGMRGTWTQLSRGMDREAEDRPGMQSKLRIVLRDEGDEARVVGARGHLAEENLKYGSVSSSLKFTDIGVHLVALDEQLDAKEAPAAEARGHSICDAL